MGSGWNKRQAHTKILATIKNLQCIDVNKDSLVSVTQNNVVYILENQLQGKRIECMKVLFEFFKSYGIFRKLKLDHFDYHQQEQFYKKLKVTKHRKGEVVFDYGDHADYFYIIVSGRVSVQIPTVVRKHLTQQEFLDYLQENDVNSIISKNQVKSGSGDRLNSTVRRFLRYD